MASSGFACLSSNTKVTDAMGRSGCRTEGIPATFSFFGRLAHPHAGPLRPDAATPPLAEREGFEPSRRLYTP